MVSPTVTPTGWAVVGPGRIAQAFAKALQSLPDARLVAVCARDAGRAAAFARQWAQPGQGLPLATTDLAMVLALPQVHAVYIATPHAQHAVSAALALQAGKAVLCEKPLVTDLAQGAHLAALSRTHGAFLMEALWTRFLPLYAHIERWLAEGAIGEVRGLQSSFCFNAPFDATSRLFDPALAGGALLDLGVYNLSMTQWVLRQALGSCPEPVLIDARALLAPTGVDQRVAATLTFAGPAAVQSQFVCALDAHADNALRILGQKGHILVPAHFSRATAAELHVHGQDPVKVYAPLAVNGFEGQIQEVQRCLRQGLIESPVMPHAESLAVLGWMDQIRQAVGVRYPWE